MQKFNDPEIENEIIASMEKIRIPVSIDFIAQKVNVAWGTARAILLNLVISGKIQMQKTTKSFIFWIENGEAES